jgi:hypothetical protein
MGEREVFEGLVAKFLLNLPREEQEDATRLSYHAEKAFYYYMDEVLRSKPGKEWEKQRNDFTLITSAAAVSFLCRDQIEKYKLTQ